MTAPRKPCPPDFAEVFIRWGWGGIQAAFGSRQEVVNRWFKESGGEALKAARQQYRNDNGNAGEMPTFHDTIYSVYVQSDCVAFVLADERTVQVPLRMFPALHAAGARGCGEAVIAEDGLSVSWPAIGETISVAHLLTRRN